MLFSSIVFLYVFLPLLLLLYFNVPNAGWRRAILIVFSQIFYARGEPVSVLLMIGCVAFNYICGAGIAFCKSRRGARAVLCTAAAANLAMLGVYKYLPFLMETLNTLTGWQMPVPALKMPLGISFFTFQALSYTVDVYRGDAPVQRSFWRLLLYVSLFPQLIAGPIVRYKDIDDQLEDRSVSLEAVCDGAFRFALGLAKKVMLANACGEAADGLLGMRLGEASVISAWAGAAFYALQIYFDFSGYSDMAIGLGGIFGFCFRENFDYPYSSRSATEFWRRWHISLGSFFRDYVYIPLGGNRHGWLRNVLLVWLLTGLWHGASWNFIAWGLYYGLLLILEKKLLMPLAEHFSGAVRRIASAFYMTAVTLVGWTIFYFTEDFGARVGLLFGIGANGLGDAFDIALIRDNVLLLAMGFFLSLPVLRNVLARFRRSTDGALAAERALKTVFVLGAVALSTVMLEGSSYNPFLYFRF